MDGSIRLGTDQHAEGPFDASNLRADARPRRAARVARTTLNSCRSTSRRTPRFEAPLPAVYVAASLKGTDREFLRAPRGALPARPPATSRITDAALIAAATLFEPLHRRPLHPGQGDQSRRTTTSQVSIAEQRPRPVDEVEHHVKQLEDRARRRQPGGHGTARADRHQLTNCAAVRRHARQVGAREGRGRAIGKLRQAPQRGPHKLEHAGAARPQRAELRHGGFRPRPPRRDAEIGPEELEPPVSLCST